MSRYNIKLCLITLTLHQLHLQKTKDGALYNQQNKMASTYTSAHSSYSWFPITFFLYLITL